MSQVTRQKEHTAMYVHENLEGVIATFRKSQDTAQQDIDRYEQLIALHGAARSGLADDIFVRQAQRQVRDGGGIGWIKEHLAIAQGERKAWSYAIEILGDYCKIQADPKKQAQASGLTHLVPTEPEPSDEEQAAVTAMQSYIDSVRPVYSSDADGLGDCIDYCIAMVEGHVRPEGEGVL